MLDSEERRSAVIIKDFFEWETFVVFPSFRKRHNSNEIIKDNRPIVKPNIQVIFAEVVLSMRIDSFLVGFLIGVDQVDS